MTWTSQQGDGSYDVFGKIFSSDGVPVTGDIRLNSALAGDQQVSSVAGLADGGFVVAWASNDSGDNDIYAQRYNSSGVAVGNEFLVNSYTTQDQTNPSVASLAGGGFAVVWQSYDQDSNEYGVYAQTYDANGAPVGNQFQVNAHTLNHQHDPSITGLTNGGFLVTGPVTTKTGPTTVSMASCMILMASPKGPSFSSTAKYPGHNTTLQ